MLEQSKKQHPIHRVLKLFMQISFDKKKEPNLKRLSFLTRNFIFFYLFLKGFTISLFCAHFKQKLDPFFFHQHPQLKNFLNHNGEVFFICVLMSKIFIFLCFQRQKYAFFKEILWKNSSALVRSFEKNLQSFALILMMINICQFFVKKNILSKSLASTIISNGIFLFYLLKFHEMIQSIVREYKKTQQYQKEIQKQSQKKTTLEKISKNLLHFLLRRIEKASIFFFILIKKETKSFFYRSVDFVKKILKRKKPNSSLFSFHASIFFSKSFFAIFFLAILSAWHQIIRKKIQCPKKAKIQSMEKIIIAIFSFLPFLSLVQQENNLKNQLPAILIYLPMAVKFKNFL